MMLSRAAARSTLSAQAVARGAASTLTARPLPVSWTRSYAKGNKPSSPPPPRFAKSQSSQDTKTPAPPPPSQPKQPQQAPEKTHDKTPAEPEEPVPDFSKLPDLTKGIPSTLEYEAAEAAKEGPASSEAGAGDEEPTPSGAGGRGKGEGPSSSYVSSSERRRRAIAMWSFGLVGLAIVGGTVYLGREWDDEERKQHDGTAEGWSLGSWWSRVRSRTGETVSYYQEPAFEKLLPDEDPAWARPYTLCISLEDMLVHSEWTREHGWRIAKRPGMDYFLRYLSQYYELVLFTSQPFATAEPLIRKLDPFHIIQWPLFREATKYKDGEIVKDLSYLNRDLKKVIIIDTKAEHVRAQPENAIVLPKWTGNPKDQGLVALVPFLEFIHTMQYDDVRKVIKSFEGTDIPTEFARREAIARAEHQKRLQGKQKKTTSGGLGSLASYFGLKPSNMSLMVTPEGEENPHEAFSKGKMLQDIARERGLRNYMILEEEIRKNGEKWLKEEQEMNEKLQKEAMKNMQGSLMGWFKPQEEGSSEKKN